MKRNLLLLLLFSGLSMAALAQQPASPAPPFCAYEPDSVTQGIINRMIREMKARKAGKTFRTQAIVTIPVVFHVIEPSTSTALITDAQIDAIMTNLNDAYSGTNFYDESPDTEIRFQRASYDPSCAATTAITRYDASGNATYVDKGVFKDGVSWETVQGWVTWPKSQYLNIWIVNKLDNAAAGVGGPTEGIILLADAVKSAFDYVTPHEVGHYLGVSHPFRDYVDDCGCDDGDGLADTPDLMATGIDAPCAFENKCTPEAMNTINPCTNAPYGNIQKNIMNYVNYQCGLLFTNDQKNLMRTTLEDYHASLLVSPALNTSTPTASAQLIGPDQISTAGGTKSYIKAFCPCGSVTQISINNTFNLTEQQVNSGVIPILGPGQSSTWNYSLTCSGGSTATKTVVYFNPGVTGIQAQCNSGGTYSVTFSNPGGYGVTASPGTLSGNSVTNIPNSSALTLTITHSGGSTRTQTVDIPCCATGTRTLVNCYPSAPKGAGNYFGIANFNFAGINKSSSTSGSDGATYMDNACSDQATTNAGTAYTMTVTGTNANSHYAKVWIDYDNDGEFESSELVLNGQTTGSTASTFSQDITIPATAVRSTPLRIRVLADYVNTSNACSINGYDDGTTNYGSGQIEDYSMTIANPLPVGLISFSGKSYEKNVILSWKTAWEKNNNGFEIYRSADAVSFELIGAVDGNGTSSKKNDYSFTDSRISPSRSYYYRLKQLDSDGKSELSRIIYVAGWYESTEVTIFPNPAQGSRFVVSHPAIGSYEIELYTLAGKSVPVRVSPGNAPNERRIKSVGKLSTGLYIVKLRSKADLPERSVNVVVGP